MNGKHLSLDVAQPYFAFIPICNIWGRRNTFLFLGDHVVPFPFKELDSQRV